MNRICRVVSSILFTIAIVWQGLVSNDVAAADLQLGVARLDITPAPGLRMWGYSNRTQGATGVLDPLMARAFVLRNGETTVGIVTLDLGRTPEDPLLDGLRRRAAAQLQIDELFITASHTHQAPSLESYDGSPNEFGVQVVAKIEQALAQAARNTEPVTIAIGRGEADYAHNRRRMLRDGRVAMQWRNAQRDATSPVDREYTVVRFNRADGTPAGVLFHYACHPVVLGSDHLQYSADYVGGACRAVETSLDTVCGFLQGACGDINPYLDKTPVDEGGVADMQKVGAALGKQLVETAAACETVDAGSPALQVERRNVPARVRWDIRDPKIHEALRKVYSRRINLLERAATDGVLQLPLTTVLLADAVALVGLPGEIFVDFQLDLKQRSPVPTTLLVGYTNGYHAYFPTIRHAAAGGYGGKTATYVAVGTGERMVDEALITLYTMTDHLHAEPRMQDYRLLEWDAIKDTPAAAGAGGR